MRPTKYRRHHIGRFPHAHKWTPEEDKIVRTTPTKEAAEKLGVSQGLFTRQQRELGVGLQHLLRR